MISYKRIIAGALAVTMSFSICLSNIGTSRIIANAEGDVASFDASADPSANASENPVTEVAPATPQRFTEDSATASSITLSWNKVEGATGYQICYYNNNLNKWYYYGGPTSNKITSTSYTIKSKTVEGVGTVVDISENKELSFYLRAFTVYGTNEDGTANVKYSDKTEAITCYTGPGKINNPSPYSYSSNSITFTWDAHKDAEGYVIKRKKSGESDYTVIGTTTETMFTDDTGVASGTTYTYKIAGYRIKDTYVGTYSAALKLSTCPDNPKTTIKGGDKRLRLNWAKVNGATGYKIYMASGNSYELIKDCSKSTTSYLLKGLDNSTKYTMRVFAYRTLDKNKDNEATYQASGVTRSITTGSVPATSTTAKTYKTKAKFKASKAYKKLPWFKKYVNFSKSYVIPGVINSNVAGFKSTMMCPQAITFAEDYLLMSAYDYIGEERSVIYVMNKSTGKLLTTIVLEDQVHVGGIAYDGANVWVCHGARLACLKFSDIDTAARGKMEYAEIPYTTLVSVKTTASFMTYYKDMLWVGKNAETGSQTMYSYTISDKTGTPTITAKDAVTIPNRVQGVAFMPNGNMVLSRSNLYIDTMAFYIAQLEYYKPTWSGNKITKIGSATNTMPMPTMNEGIALDGSYLYVVYESPTFATTTYPMDRICAFKKSGLTKKVKKK